MILRRVRTIAYVLLVSFAVAAGAQSPAGAADDTPRLLWGNVGQLGVANILDEKQDPLDVAGPKEEGKRGNGFDTLTGNGSPAGYMLSRGNIVADSITVLVDGRRLVRNKDYYLDPLSGGLSFAEPIDRMQTIRATYQYMDGQNVARNMVGLPLLPTFFGGNGGSNASFLHAYRAADAKGGLPFDVLTFGMKMNWDVGSAGLESMLYMSDPREGAGAVGLLDKPSGGKKAPAPVSDKLLVQKASFDLGASSRVSLGYQDIGENFSGFSTLREQGVLPKDVVNQLEKEKGVKRLSAALELKPSSLMPEGTPWNRLNWSRVYDNSGVMDSFRLSYSTPQYGLTAAMRNVDPDFRRLGSLSKDELSDLALMTRMQFDPNATLGQVTDEDRKAVVREAGVNRHLLSSYVKLTPALTGTLSFLNLNDGRGDVARQTFSMAGQNWQWWMSSQSVSQEFTKLGALAPVEQAQFGNEYGMNKFQAGLSAKLMGSKLSLNSDYSHITSQTGGVVQAGMGLAGKYMNFKANYQSIDNDFARISDLATPQKKQMLQDRGFTKWDMSLGGQLSSALKVDSALMRAVNSEEDLTRESNVLNIMYSPTDKTKMVLQHNHSINGSAGQVLSGSMRDLQSIEQRFNNNWFVSAGRDSKLTQAGGGDLAGTITETYHVETDKSQRHWLAYDRRTVDNMNGSFEDSSTYNLQTRLGNRITLSGMHSVVDRGEEPSEELQKMGMSWTLSPSLNFGMEMFNRSTNYAGNGGGYNFSLSGQVAERLGPFTKLNLTGEYGMSRLGGDVKSSTNALKLDAVWGKNLVGMEYSHIVMPGGKVHLARGYRLKTDPDPNKWYHIDLYMKDKDAGWGQLRPIRNIAADVRLSPTTQLAYTVNQYKELPNGLVELSTSRSLKLTTKLAGSMNLVFDRRHDQNIKAGTETLKSNFGLQRKVSRGMMVDMYFGLDRAITPTGSVDGKSIRLGLDHQISPDHFLSFQGEATRWENSNPAIPSRVTAEARLDFRMPFDL